jgi:hypothetical protein
MKTKHTDWHICSHDLTKMCSLFANYAKKMQQINTYHRLTDAVWISDEITSAYWGIGGGGGYTTILDSKVQRMAKRIFVEAFTRMETHQKASYLIRTSCSSRNLCNWITLMYKSVSLNSYGMFHPRGPNVRRSWTRAWKKHSPYSNLLKLSDCLQLSKNSESLIGCERYDLCSQEKKNKCRDQSLLGFSGRHFWSGFPTKFSFHSLLFQFWAA